MHRPQTWAAARTPQTRAFLVETITNPLMRVGLLREIRGLRPPGGPAVGDRQHVRDPGEPPAAAGRVRLQRLHSATKYLGGHSDLVAGAVMGSAELIDRVRRTLNHYGGSLDPHAYFLLARGIKTFALRAFAPRTRSRRRWPALASTSRRSPWSTTPPGLASHLDHKHAAELLSGFGGMLSLRLHGGEQAAQALLDAVRLPFVAPSLGGVGDADHLARHHLRTPERAPRTGRACSASPPT